MKILITGGLGFIGSNFIKMMLNKYPDYDVTNLDKVTYAGNPENLKDIASNKNYHFSKGDICDSDVVDKLSVGKDTIINFAAESHVDRSIADPKEFVRTDILGTYNLLEAAKNNKISKFLQISTDEVYGSIEKGSFTEESLIKPNSPYSASKAGADLMVIAFNKTFGLPTLITRSSNNFGPYQYPEKLIPLLITNLIEGKKIPIYGDGMNVRDWIYVLDNCEGIDAVLHKGKIGEIYNIGGGNEKPNIEIVKFLLKELSKYESEIEFVKDRRGHDRRYSLDSTKAMKLGWKPKHDFSNALKETVRWYKDNQDWWNNVKTGEFENYYQKQYNETHKMGGKN
jgi:dTDP-glucose 4,6-dehydratase